MSTRCTPHGHVVWTVKLPIAYPSDPQQIGPDLYLIADYSVPGGLYEFTRDGHDRVELPVHVPASRCSTIPAWPSCFRTG